MHQNDKGKITTVAGKGSKRTLGRPLNQSETAGFLSCLNLIPQLAWRLRATVSVAIPQNCLFGAKGNLPYKTIDHGSARQKHALTGIGCSEDDGDYQAVVIDACRGVGLQCGNPRVNWHGNFHAGWGRRVGIELAAAASGQYYRPGNK